MLRKGTQNHEAVTVRMVASHAPGSEASHNLSMLVPGLSYCQDHTCSDPGVNSVLFLFNFFFFLWVPHPTPSSKAIIKLIKVNILKMQGQHVHATGAPRIVLPSCCKSLGKCMLLTHSVEAPLPLPPLIRCTRDDLIMRSSKPRSKYWIGCTVHT